MSQNYKISVLIDAKGASGAVSDLGKVDAKLNSVGQTAKNALASFSGNLAADAFQKISSLAVAGGSALLDYSAGMEQTKIGFERLEGSATKASEQLARIKKFAVETPFQLEGLLPTVQRFEEMGKKGESLLPVLKDIGNLVAGGVSKSGESLDQRLERVGVAIKQIFDKGRVQKEELDQLSEAGVNALDALSKGLGKSTAETLKLVEQGTVSAEVFLAALQKYSQANFGDAMLRQSKTFNGAMSTIKDTIMQTSADAFEPWFDEISKFTVRFSEEIQKNGGDLEAVGATIANYIGQGLGAALPAIAKAQGANVVNVFKKTFTGEWTGFGFYGVDFLRGLSSSVFGDAESGIVKVKDAVKDLKTAGQQGPDLAAMLKADTAKKQTEDLTKIIYDLTNKVIGFGEQTEVAATRQKLLAQSIDLKNPLAKNALALAGQVDRLKEWKKQSDALYNTISDLNLQIAFFGQESEVAATKQKLMTQGVYDFNSALAQNAISLAAQLDSLKANKKAQDDYNNRLKSAREHIQDIQDGAFFDIKFPDATELNRFDVWVKTQGENFKELKSQIDATRAALEISAFMSGYSKKLDLVKQGLTGIDEQIKSITENTKDGFGETVGEFAKVLGLSGVKDEFGVDFTAEKFIEESKKYADAYRNFQENTNRETGEALEKAALIYRNFLQTFYLNTEGGKLRFFGDKGQIDDFIAKIGRLGVVVKQADLKTGLKELDAVLEDLNLNIAGFGAKTELQKFDDWLSDANVTRAIEKRAAAIGMQADALKELLRQQKEGQLAGATRPRIVGAGATENPFLEGLFGRGGAEKITSEAEYIKGVYRDLGQTAGDVIATMVQGGASLLEQWIATGEVSGQAIRQMTASIIAGLVAQSAVKAIFELAEGFAATAQHRYSDAAMHFTAAKIYGTVAAVSAAVGIGLGAALGKPNKGGGNAQSQPDYYTSNPGDGSGSSSNYVQSSNRNFGVSSNSQQNFNKEIVAAIDRLNEKLEPVHPDHILKVAARKNKGLLTDVVVEGLKSNGSRATAMGKALRLD